MNIFNYLASACLEMQLLYTKILGASGVVAALMLAGCGGGASPRPEDHGPFTIDSVIERNDFYDADDDRYYEIFLAEINRNGRAEVEMSSFDLDSQVYIYRRDRDGDYDLIAEDDDSGDGPDAFVDFEVRRGEVYRIITTSARPREFGDYRIFFSREFGRPLASVPRGNARTAPELKLPAMKAKGVLEKRANQ